MIQASTNHYKILFSNPIKVQLRW